VVVILCAKRILKDAFQGFGVFRGALDSLNFSSPYNRLRRQQVFLRLNFQIPIMLFQISFAAIN
jgi:hypothetical protein